MAPYMPPAVKQRRVEQDLWEIEKAERRRRLAEEDAAAAASGASSGPRTLSIRALARQWEPKLEHPGACCFNPLQMDDGIEVDDDHLQATCLVDSELPRSGPGVKGLPMIAGGRYQYEVELLTDCALSVGWSAATSLPSSFDVQSFGYHSDGVLVGHLDGAEPEPYGPPFGRAGDIVGVFIDWPPGGCSSNDDEDGTRISFALNGRRLGEAFNVCFSGASASACCPALQLHICQAPGPSFKVLLHGASSSTPLCFPVAGFLPLSDYLETHFCPFSRAVLQAGDALAEWHRIDERNISGKPPTVARRLIHGYLGSQLPLSHLAQELHAEGRSLRKVSLVVDD
jgi:hypothetical protein